MNDKIKIILLLILIIEIYLISTITIMKEYNLCKEENSKTYCYTVGLIIEPCKEIYKIIKEMKEDEKNI